MKTIRFLAAATAAAFASPGVAATDLPTGGNVVSGTATISTPAAGVMQIDQSSQRAIINWDSFSIGAGAHVNFSQPGASSVALNRVVGGVPSEIFGRLTANGQVFLTNPNGVLFAPGAGVEVGSLVATTLSISDQDFLAGTYRFQNAGGAASVVNKGSIVTPNGYAALAGPKVRNEGTIIAQRGTVALAAGDRVLLDMVGDRLINVAVEQAALDASIENTATGTVEANGGRVLMTARTANALLDTVINNDGVIRANRLAEVDGEIVLDARPNGLAAGNGTFEASGTILINMDESPGPVIPPPPTPLLPSLPGTVVFQEPFTLSSGGSLTLSAGSGISLDSMNRVAITSATLSPLEMTGGVTLNAPAGQALVAGGNFSLKSTDIGRVAPMQHSIVGIGVTLPADALILR